MFKNLHPKAVLAQAAFILLLAAQTPVIALQPETSPAPKDAELAAQAKGYSQIDLVLCLDTSNSMDDLIESAKLQLWTVVNTLAKADPAPKLRIALFSYGNDSISAENGWVRKELDFTDQLDQVYEKLFTLKTNGGTEYVARVTRAALQEPWREGDDKVLRLIFVAGNEPANQDPTFTLESVLGEAKARKIFVNPILCNSNNPDDAVTWNQVAKLGGGRYASIDPSEQVAYVTPFDVRLIELSEKLNKTYYFYGTLETQSYFSSNQAAQDSNALSLNSAVAAERAVSKSSALYTNKGDLVEFYQTNREAALATKEEELPEELKGKTKEEQEKLIQQKAKEREEIQKEILELNQQRLANIEEQKAAQSQSGEKSLDSALIQILREQASTQGITIP